MCSGQWQRGQARWKADRGLVFMRNSSWRLRCRLTYCGVLAAPLRCYEVSAGLEWAAGGGERLERPSNWAGTLPCPLIS